MKAIAFKAVMAVFIMKNMGIGAFVYRGLVPPLFAAFAANALSGRAANYSIAFALID